MAEPRETTNGRNAVEMSRELPPHVIAMDIRMPEIDGIMAEGKTNADIAEALFSSAATVKTHGSHVLMKLVLQNRIQAVGLAYESGLVRPGIRRD
ncbi:MAG: response regulator transcription factor [Acidimicrobiales bacterium]